MKGLGTIVNALAVIFGGVIGLFAKRLINDRMQETVIKATGFSTIFLGASGTLARMLTSADGGATLNAVGSMTVILSLVLGAVTGELIDIDARFERFGAWLRHKTGSDGDSHFINGFVTASLTVCIGAMAIMGSIQDGIYGDHATLFAKAVLDFVESGSAAGNFQLRTDGLGSIGVVPGVHILELRILVLGHLLVDRALEVGVDGAGRVLAHADGVGYGAIAGGAVAGGEDPFDRGLEGGLVNDERVLLELQALDLVDGGGVNVLA